MNIGKDWEMIVDLWSEEFLILDRNMLKVI